MLKNITNFLIEKNYIKDSDVLSFDNAVFIDNSIIIFYDESSNKLEVMIRYFQDIKKRDAISSKIIMLFEALIKENYIISITFPTLTGEITENIVNDKYLLNKNILEKLVFFLF
jgi:hypothetical protein